MQNSTKPHSTDKNTDKTKLYRHFDSEGALLYVGISLSPTYRLSQHRLTASWFDDIATVTIEDYPSRSAALEAEARAIHAEHPIYNRMRPTPKRAPRGSWVTFRDSDQYTPPERVARLRFIHTEKDFARMCKSQKAAERYQKLLWHDSLSDEDYDAYLTYWYRYIKLPELEEAS